MGASAGEDPVGSGQYAWPVLVAIIARILSRLVVTVSEPFDARRRGAPRWRVLALLVLVATLCLLPLHLSPHTARVLGSVLLGVSILAVLTGAAVFRRLLGRLVEGGPLRLGRHRVEVPRLHGQVRAFEGLMALLRRSGLALPALVFFCLWATIYMFIWAHEPAACPADPAHPCAGAAFLGAGTRPTFGDFLYYSVNMAFANPAPDLVAHSRVGHTAATIEVLSGVGLVTLYAGAFFGIGASSAGRPGSAATVEGRPPL